MSGDVTSRCRHVSMSSRIVGVSAPNMPMATSQLKVRVRHRCRHDPSLLVGILLPMRALSSSSDLPTWCQVVLGAFEQPAALRSLLPASWRQTWARLVKIERYRHLFGNLLAVTSRYDSSRYLPIFELSTSLDLTEGERCPQQRSCSKILNAVW